MSHRQEPCPIPGCLDPKARGHLMCRNHWRQVPAALRQAVNRTWKAVSTTTRHDYVARIAAIRSWREAALAARQFILEKEHIDVRRSDAA
ncbi:MAG: hypothetical protein WCA78_00530 [Rhizomicrobium sp.]